MMRRVMVATVGVVGLSLAAVPASTAQETPTYNQHVGQILLDNCASCHRPNQVAPMPLLSYTDARPWARAIKAKVEAREMPPWFADPRFGEFTNDISLSDDEIATIVAWANGGAPEGDGPAPAPPRLSAAGWGHPSGLDPDYVIDFPIEWQVAPDGETPNFNLYTPLPFDDVRLASAAQVLPGNYTVTHHITTALVNMPPGMTLGTGPAWPGGPVVDYVPVPDEDADAAAVAAAAAALGVNRNEQGEDVDRVRGDGFGPYIPGVGADVSGPGQVRKIRGDLFDYIVWNLHYQATGKPETARPSIGVWWATEEATSLEHSLKLREHTSEGQQLVARPPLPLEEQLVLARTRQIGQGLSPLLAPIPPHHGNWTVTGIGAFQNDATIHALFIHAHVRAKDFTYVLTYPDGREEILLRVPNYSFDWQFEYQLAEPVKVPAGSTVKAVARYDNSRANRVNPAPQKEVYWSEQSWDDMFNVSVRYTVDGEVPVADSTQGQD